MIALFYRPLIINKYNESKYLKKLKINLNLKNIDSFYSKSIYDLWNINYESIFLSYRFQILKEWIFNNQNINSGYLKNLLYIIKILDLENHLNGYEKNYIEHYESINFCKTRNIKKLIVDFNVNKNEEIWFKFSCLKFIHDNHYSDFEDKNEIFLSNQRLIISNAIDIRSIKWVDINQLKLINNYIKISTKFGNFIIISDEIYEIYVSVERISKIINRQI